jgi:hypothetical protein
VVGAFNHSLWPTGEPTLEDAWLGIYQTLLYYEPTTDPPLLHINEANELRRGWGRRARVAEAFIAGAMEIEPVYLSTHIDRMMQLPRWLGKQRHNPIGNGLRILLAEVLRRWGSQSMEFEQEQKGTYWFPGITMPGRSETPSVDVMMVKNERPRGLVSCKWSIRHDRISDPTNECQEYKAAAARRQLPTIGFYVFTNEFNPSRLEKVLNQPCVDGLVHVHRPLVEHLFPGHILFEDSKFLDLVDFTRLTLTW